MLIAFRRWLVDVLAPPSEPVNVQPEPKPRALPPPAAVPRPRPREPEEGDRSARRLEEAEARAQKAETRARKADEAKARADAAAKTAEARASEATERARRAESALSRETHAREQGSKRRRGKGDAIEAKLQRAGEELRAAEQRTREAERQRTETDEKLRAMETRLEEAEVRSKELSDRAREAAEEAAERRAATATAPSGDVRQRGRPAVSVEAHFSPGDECLNAIRAQLDRARATVDVCVFTITDDRIAEALLAAHRRGVHVRVVTDNDKALDEGSDVRRLERAGIEVREDRTEFHMHHKFAVFDSKVLLTGSYNWTRGAARYNEENLIVTDDARLVGPFTREFQALWSRLAPP